MRDPDLTSRAKSMRKAMSEPETRMWLELRANRFDSVKFRRQKVIGNYIADFAANDPKLVIELDGDSHGSTGPYDADRTRHLEQAGYIVIRYANSDVMTNMEGVLRDLADRISELRESPPPPTPSPKGEGA
jgi:very-short-patch-repair endonuclease